MKFTLSWLKEYLDTECNLEQILNKLNEIGLEVDDVIDNSKIYENFKCVLIEECKDHPDSDHLHLCKVKCINSNGENEILDIVCGAPNARKGSKTILAPVNSKLPNGLEIKKTKIRGYESNGMLCSGKELNLNDDHEGIIELPNNSNVGDKLVDIFNINDPIIEIAITPNRGDCLSIYGIARDLACAGIGKLKKIENIELKNDFETKIKLNVVDNNCNSFYFREIKNVKNCESPDWLKKRLKSIDINPKNALIDITNYVMFCYGRPLHCYDKNKINGNINVRPSKENEDFIDLFDNKYKLKSNATLICDDEKILCLGGIIGSNNSGSSLDTNNIILECAVFDAINTARTSRILNIQTDSKYRFERGIDYLLTQFVLDFTTKLIKEICGGEISNTVKIEKEFIEKEINLNYSDIEKLLGIKIEKSIVLDILKNLSYKVEEKNDFLIKVPAYKNNILVKEDIIDDIIRIYGYDKLKNEDFINNKVFEKDGNLILKKTINKLYSIREVLSANGYTELITYSFLNEKDNSYFCQNKEELKIINPIINDLSYMRGSLIPNILNAIKKNNNRGYSNLSFFEIGHVFNEAKLDKENNVLVGIRSGKIKEKDIYNESRSFDTFDVKKDLFDVFDCLGINGEKMNIDTNIPNYYHPHRSGRVLMGKTVVAYFGELHPNVNSAFDLKSRTMLFELLLDNLPSKIFNEEKIKNSFKTNDLQQIKRDLAFIIDSNIMVGEIIKNIYNIDKEHIVSVNLFDIYIDEKIRDKKSIAFTVVIQPKNENMNKEKIDNISNKIINYITKEYNGILRDK